MRFPFQLIDLTQPLSLNTPGWDASCGFHHTNTLDYSDCTTEVKFRVQELSMPAGIGTHMDAPAHCIPGADTIDKLNLDALLSPCVVIDASIQAHEAWQCSVDDIQTFERKYGKISKGSFVIIHTGWSHYWNQPDYYRNQLQFPSVSKEAAMLLLERDIAGLGIDTLSPDTEASGYPVHQAILGAGKYIVENIVNAEQLPPVGSFSLCLPLLITGGTEAPMRLVAMVMKETA